VNQAVWSEPFGGDNGGLAWSVLAPGHAHWTLKETGWWARLHVTPGRTVPSGLAHSDLFNYSKDYPITKLIQT
jgi:hypothetical protein